MPTTLGPCSCGFPCIVMLVIPRIVHQYLLLLEPWRSTRSIFRSGSSSSWLQSPIWSKCSKRCLFAPCRWPSTQTRSMHCSTSTFERTPCPVGFALMVQHFSITLADSVIDYSQSLMLSRHGSRTSHTGVILRCHGCPSLITHPDRHLSADSSRLRGLHIAASACSC